MDDAQTMLYRIGREKLLTLNAVVGIFPAFSRGDDIVVEREGRKVVLPQLRCQSASAAENLSLADYVLPEGEIVSEEDYYTVESPYNTYLNKGLPPGPIANPGLESIMAALNPESTNYYYYALGDDGVHHFFTSYSEHQAFLNS